MGESDRCGEGVVREVEERGVESGGKRRASERRAEVM
jgi:hypothetical protein